jgi:hypothetical protein
MQIHRSRLERSFTILTNAVLQDRRLSYTARGLLADLLSRPDGWREDGRSMADTSTQGRAAVAKALRELTAHGYYRVERVRRPDGTFTSVAHVYDTPYVADTAAYAAPAPEPVKPGPGRPGPGKADGHPVKDREKAPTLPGPARLEVAAALLHRVVRDEPRLRLGAVEAVGLAPLVTAWLERGCGEREIGAALRRGLPERVHSAPALVRDRLTRKLPPPVAREAPRVPRWSECGVCGDPVAHGGVCRGCARSGACGEGGIAERAPTAAQVAAARGRALVRAALASPRPPGRTAR